MAQQITAHDGYWAAITPDGKQAVPDSRFALVKPPWATAGSSDESLTIITNWAQNAAAKVKP